jgi:hypothetical protein
MHTHTCIITHARTQTPSLCYLHRTPTGPLAGVGWLVPVCTMGKSLIMCRVGQNRIYTPYMTVYMVNSLPKIPYTHRIYMVLANPNYVCGGGELCTCVHACH